jgi:acyl-CoA synthetase (AMP-forming)/AMP-acid ligase II
MLLPAAGNSRRGMKLRPLESVRQAGQFLDPRIARRLLQAGALGPRRAVAAATTVPWVLGRGPSLAILSQINAVAHPHKPALHDRSGALTWRELDRRANRLAGALQALGISGEDTVATLLRNGREQVETLLACQRLGVPVAPLNTWAKAPELAYAIERAEPALLIFDPRHFDQAKRAVGRAKLLAAGEPYEDALAAHSAGPPFPLALDRTEPRIVIHTSGTTGKPKAAARSAASAGARSLVGLLGVVPYRSDDVILCPAPLFHSFGLLAVSMATLLGATLVLPERFDPKETLAVIEGHAVTAVSLVPVMIQRILSLPKRVREKHDLSTLRIVLASGSAMAPETRASTMHLFGEVLYDLYGSTEAGWVAIASPRDMAADQRTLGRPVEGVEVAVLDDRGQELPPGEVGALHVKSDALFEGYVSGEDVPERDGYLSMGDLGWRDDEGRLFVQGRSDEMVVIGGENVYPVEVEEVIEGLDGVRGVAVVGAPDEEYGHVLAAFVEGSVDADRIKEACRRDLASFKVPRTVKVVDRLPRTDTGKVKKADLTQQLEGALTSG